VISPLRCQVVRLGAVKRLNTECELKLKLFLWDYFGIISTARLQWGCKDEKCKGLCLYKMPTPKGVADRICSHWLAKTNVTLCSSCSSQSIPTSIQLTRRQNTEAFFRFEMATSTSRSNPLSNHVTQHHPISQVQRLDTFLCNYPRQLLNYSQTIGW